MGDEALSTSDEIELRNYEHCLTNILASMISVYTTGITRDEPAAWACTVQPVLRAGKPP
jgi:hypothetical protein